MATNDPAIRAHQAWLGYLQPDGLVVSPAALVDAQAYLDTNVLPLQEQFRQFVVEIESGETERSAVPDFPRLARDFLLWPDECLYGLTEERPLPDSLRVAVQEGETLAPSFVFRDPNPKDPAQPWLLAVQVCAFGARLDARAAVDQRSWSASMSQRFERLLRETGVTTGLLTNGTEIRLMYAPPRETAGSVTFPVAAMTEVGGRPILAAFHMLLDVYRLLSAPGEARLPALLRRSRDYQSSVSTLLAQQVLDSLYELLRGFHAANERTGGALLRSAFMGNRDDIYGGLLTVLMRLVFSLYAEDRGLMPGSDLYVRNYSVHGLFERLRTDNEHYPDTMDLRYGAWAQLLALFRAIHDGCRYPQLQTPARSGYLFNPDRFPFLEGRQGDAPAPSDSHHVPLISDGVVFRVLRNLLVLDGERLSYRTLDVEEIGSVYQTVMGFRLELAAGQSIAIAGKRKHKNEVPAPIPINLDELLAKPGTERLKWFKEQTEQDLSGNAATALKQATSLDALLAALERRIARNATPGPVPRGTMLLQPTDERRRSGSHYTPRSFTEPIVRTTLRPVLERLQLEAARPQGVPSTTSSPTPEAILGLKVCDPACGSGAFLVETCRQLAAALAQAWHAHGKTPVLPPDEDEDLYARRLVAQCCLYGVDRNDMAVDLAKLSLWLTTLAKDHAFTFLDHAIRCGDSLVGLTRQQIIDFHWRPERQRVLGQQYVEERLRLVSEGRKAILDGGDTMPPALKRQKLDYADESLSLVRFAGDLVVAAFFNADKDRKRQELRDDYLLRLNTYLAKGDLNARPTEVQCGLRSGQFPVIPFHWQIEFPEIFDRENGGFDAFVGNPPFAGKNTMINGNRAGYLDWLKVLHPQSHGNADLVAHFFRRGFDLLRPAGAFGLIATNTIAQGDTRATGLCWICTHGGTIYAARKRTKWPGQAAVVVSVVHVAKDAVSPTAPRPPPLKPPYDLDGRSVERITAYLFHAGGHENPATLEANANKSFQGSIVLGMGFTFDDTDTSGVANPLSLMHELIAKDPRNAERIFPYIGGEEVNDSPTHAHHRYVINFADFPLRREDLGRTWAAADERQRTQWLRTGIVPLDCPEPVAADWPDLLAIVKEKVKPQRDQDKREVRKKYWWRFGETTPALFAALRGLERVLAVSRVGNAFAWCFLPANVVMSERLVVVVHEQYMALSLAQSRVHAVWARLYGSSLKDDLMYAPADCFETFPFPPGWETNTALEAAGKEYYEFRAALMVRNNEGLTKTYNRFRDPDETAPDILKLRELHAAMDRAVLDPYGWSDIPTTCEFLLDYEDEDSETGGQGDGETVPAHRRKKPWRYRWPDDIRDEVLARLLALNAQRAEEERVVGSAGESAKRRATRSRCRRETGRQDGQLDLIV